MGQLLVGEIVPLNLVRRLATVDLKFHNRRSAVAQQGVVGHGQFEGVVRHFKQPLKVDFPSAAIFHVHFHQRTRQRLVRNTLVRTEIHPVDGPVIIHRGVSVCGVLDQLDAHLF